MMNPEAISEPEGMGLHCTGGVDGREQPDSLFSGSKALKDLKGPRDWRGKKVQSCWRHRDS